MKDQPIVCNIGPFDSRIDVASLGGGRWEEIKPQVAHLISPDGKRIILLAMVRRPVCVGALRDPPSRCRARAPSTRW